MTHNDGAIDKRGFRYANISDPTLWKEVLSLNASEGSDNQEIAGDIILGEKYYIQPFAKNGSNTYYGNLVNYQMHELPVASQVSISGSLIITSGATVEGVYTYQSDGLAEEGSTFKWYRSDDIDGVGKIEIIEETSLTYLLNGALDNGKFISFEVTPNNKMHTGLPVESPGYLTSKLTGEGTSKKPYQIHTLSELKGLSETVSLWDKYFIQMADIDASDSKEWNDNAGFSPIGNSSNQFLGQYDGDNYSIDNLYINRPNENIIGLFGQVQDAEISNVNINGAHITGNSSVGGLAGASSRSSNAKLIGISVHHSIIVGNGNDIGGIIGLSVGYSIYNSSSIANEITGNLNIGGIAGKYDYQSALRYSYNTSSVSGSNSVGGLVGLIRGESSIRYSYNSGLVKANGGNKGAIVGYSERSTFHSCYYDNETSLLGDNNKGVLGLSTAEFLNKDLFISWQINEGAYSDRPWVQIDGECRPYLYTQDVSIGNGLTLKDSIRSYVINDNSGTLDERGFRYAKIAEPRLWEQTVSTLISDGFDTQEITGNIIAGEPYYVQPFVKFGTKTYYGNMVIYEKDQIPLATEVSVSGDFITLEGSILTGTYTYQSGGDLEEQGSTYKWYRSDDAQVRVK